MCYHRWVASDHRKSESIDIDSDPRTLISIDVKVCSDQWVDGWTKGWLNAGRVDWLVVWCAGCLAGRHASWLRCRVAWTAQPFLRKGGMIAFGEISGWWQKVGDDHDHSDRSADRPSSWLARSHFTRFTNPPQATVKWIVFTTFKKCAALFDLNRSYPQFFTLSDKLFCRKVPQRLHSSGNTKEFHPFNWAKSTSSCFTLYQ